MILQTFNTDVRPLVSDLSESERNAWFLDPTGNICLSLHHMLLHLTGIIHQREMAHDLNYFQVIWRPRACCLTNKRK